MANIVISQTHLVPLQRFANMYEKPIQLCRQFIFYQYHLFHPCSRAKKKRDKSVSFVNLVWCMIWRYFWLEAIAEKISWRFYNQFFVCCITLTLQSHVSILKKTYIPSLIIYFICEKNVLRVLVCRDSCLPQKSSSIFRILKLWLCFNGCRNFFSFGTAVCSWYNNIFRILFWH